MTETKNPGEKTLTVTPTKTLTLKRSVEQGVVRQSFSHGRTKAVVVEKVKRRTVGPGDGKVAEAGPAATPAVSAPRRGASGARGAVAGSTTGAAVPAHSIQRLVMGDAIDEIIRAGHRNRDEGRLVSIQAIWERR